MASPGPTIEGSGQWAVAVKTEPSPDWDSFVESRPDASVYLFRGWPELVGRVFGHRAFFIEARSPAGVLQGVLPVVQQRSLIGNFATSLPFFNYGGALCEDERLAPVLMEHACSLAAELGCSYLEFRDSRQVDGPWRARTDKVGMLLELPAEFDELARRLGSKLRSQVRRAEREAPTVRVGGAELVDDFYDVFAHNMRDLGTPVYPKRFFAAIAARFPEVCRLLVVYHAKQPAAAGFVITWRRRAEIPWAACRSEAKPLGLNMKLYWEVLSLAVQQGCTTFDFGRSTVDAGTYRFKRQWGAEPVQLYWHRWLTSSARGATHGRDGRAMRYAARLWQRLPLRVANTLGPLISPGLPW